MIRTGKYSDINEMLYDENWMIVRKPDQLADFVRHEPLLGPSPELFRKYREAFHKHLFDREFFDSIYVLQFIKELSENTAALEVLKYLVKAGREKDILLACYCEEEALCHRSIIAGILLGMDHSVIDTNPEYYKYYEMFCSISDHIKD